MVTAERPGARRSVAEWLSGDGAAWVRINAATTQDWPADVDALRGLPGLQGVMLAKSESGQQVRDTSDRLGAAVPVLALVESALGIEFAYDIASEAATLRLAFGSGDFRRDTGAGAEPDALAYARGRLVVASAAAGIAAPIDGPRSSTIATPGSRPWPSRGRWGCPGNSACTPRTPATSTAN
ncbi:hypothetical protein MLGJGCBP_08583 [Rhodococcus sp. T7]|nr:hypothetical protein MLGJGCBP_08583 [Rhodococcus sp. T7]